MPRCHCAADRRLAMHLFAVLRSRPNGLPAHEDFERLPSETQADFHRLAEHVRRGKYKHVLTEWGHS